MNIYILTQKDAFYIPKLLNVFHNNLDKDIKIAGLAIIKGEINISNIIKYVKLLGFSGFILNLVYFFLYNILDFISLFLSLSSFYSVEGFCREKKIPKSYIKNINSKQFRDKLGEIDIDIIVSVACPQIIKRKLRNCVPKGCINIHGALLPKYRGMLPSFWVLANNEKETGVTVHYVNEKIDDGPIIYQRRIKIEDNDTLHSLVLKSKVNYGGVALAETLKIIKNDSIVLKENSSEDASYFSFPTKEAITRFKKLGRKVR